MNAPQLPISITLGDVTTFYPNADATLKLVREVGSPIKPAHDTLLAMRGKLGAVLLQVKRQVPHGRWTTYLQQVSRDVGLNAHTVVNAMSVAKKLCTPGGEIDPGRVAAAAAQEKKKFGEPPASRVNAEPEPGAEESYLHRGADLTGTPEQPLTLRRAEELAGRRVPPWAKTTAPTAPNAASKSDTSAYDDEPDPGDHDSDVPDLDDDGLNKETGDFKPGADHDDEPDRDEKPFGDDDDDNNDVPLRQRGGLRGLGGGSDHPAGAPSEMLEGTTEVVGAGERAGRAGVDAVGDGADAAHVLGRAQWRVGPQRNLFDDAGIAVRTALGRVERSALRNGTADAELARRVRAATERYVAELELIASGSPALNAV